MDREFEVVRRGRPRQARCVRVHSGAAPPLPRPPPVPSPRATTALTRCALPSPQKVGCYNRLSHACECPTGDNAVFVDGLPIGSLRDDGTNTCDDAEEKSDNRPPPTMTAGCNCECMCGTPETEPCGA